MSKKKRKINWKGIEYGIRKAGSVAGSGLDWYFGKDVPKSQRSGMDTPQIDNSGMDVIYGGGSSRSGYPRTHHKKRHQKTHKSSSNEYGKKKAPVIIINQ